jgi:hypothetical protein
VLFEVEQPRIVEGTYNINNSMYILKNSLAIRAYSELSMFMPFLNILPVCVFYHLVCSQHINTLRKRESTRVLSVYANMCLHIHNLVVDSTLFYGHVYTKKLCGKNVHSNKVILDLCLETSTLSPDSADVSSTRTQCPCYMLTTPDARVRPRVPLHAS